MHRDSARSSRSFPSPGGRGDPDPQRPSKQKRSPAETRGEGTSLAPTSVQAPSLVADVGGTNVRFALAHVGTPPRLERIRAIACENHGGLREAMEHYLSTEARDARPTTAAVAVASPIEDGRTITLTNRPWTFERGALAAALGLERLVLLNDFGAIAWAIPALAPSDFETVQGDPAAPWAGPISVVGPGTGLGVALLIGDAERGWRVVETEGGHVAFAPQDDAERGLARFLEAKHGRISAERVLSGAGLAAIDAVERGSDSLRDPAAIGTAALSGDDAAARAALERFCGALGAFAGDAALIHGARSVVIAGGIVPRFLPLLRTSAFLERFRAKGRYARRMAELTVRVLTHPVPGLVGAAAALAAASEDGR